MHWDSLPWSSADPCPVCGVRAKSSCRAALHVAHPDSSGEECSEPVARDGVDVDVTAFCSVLPLGSSLTSAAAGAA